MPSSVLGPQLPACVSSATVYVMAAVGMHTGFMMSTCVIMSICVIMSTCVIIPTGDMLMFYRSSWFSSIPALVYRQYLMSAACYKMTSAFWTLRMTMAWCKTHLSFLNMSALVGY